VNISPTDSAALHAFLSKRQDHFTTWFPAVMTLGGILLVQTVDWLKRRSDRRHEDARMLATQTLTRRLDALTALWLDGAAWHDTLLDMRSRPNEYDHAAWSSTLAPLIGRFDRSLMLSHLYVSDQQFDTLRRFRGCLAGADMQVRVNPNSLGYQTGPVAQKSREKVWSDLDAAYSAGVNVMRELFGARALEQITTNVNSPRR
jgi:hypothetical protein